MKWYTINIDSSYLDKFMKLEFHDFIIKNMERIIRDKKELQLQNIPLDITLISLGTLKYITNSIFVTKILSHIPIQIPLSITVEENNLIPSLPEKFTRLKEEVGEYFAAYKMMLFMKEMKII